ncbi:MAG: 1-(5-phosphoribosyl)-5-[(5-phosphoribosylamino)methylideneamino]imidazole-4-carboxamide isomerase [Bacillaceae bacterium]
MILFPAIDIKGGKCVRLVQGDFDKVNVYDEDPVQVAKKFKESGTDVVHVVDLDGALEGDGRNKAVIEAIIKETGLRVQVGGGIRDLKAMDEWISRGVWRVILGTVAIENPQLVKEAVEKYGDKVVVSVDAKNGKVATQGWTNISEICSFEFCEQLEKMGVKTVVYTDISKDGMLVGPNFESYQEIQRRTSLDVIASGGVSSLADLRCLQEMNLYGAISGKALYENRFTLEEGLRCLQDESFLV